MYCIVPTTYRVRAVGEVHADNVDAGLNQLNKLLDRLGLGAWAVSSVSTMSYHTMQYVPMVAMMCVARRATA